jgi:hypothetical protein
VLHRGCPISTEEIVERRLNRANPRPPTSVSHPTEDPC